MKYQYQYQVSYHNYDILVKVIDLLLLSYLAVQVKDHHIVHLRFVAAELNLSIFLD